MKEKKKSIKQEILEALQQAMVPISCHEFVQMGINVNDHTANTRINELRREDKWNIHGCRRRDKNYFEYWLDSEKPRLDDDEPQQPEPESESLPDPDTNNRPEPEQMDLCLNTGSPR